MAYTLYNDKTEDFECSLSLEGASLDNSFARLILECNEYNLIFKGTISEGGKCRIPIKNLKRLFPNESQGNLMLEVVADDAYFSPWSDEVTIKPSKVVTVESVNLGNDISKPKMVVTEIKEKPKQEVKEKVTPNINELCESLKNSGFTKDVIYKNRKKAIPVLGRVIHEYYKSFNVKPKAGILKEIVNKL